MRSCKGPSGHNSRTPSGLRAFLMRSHGRSSGSGSPCLGHPPSVTHSFIHRLRNHKQQRLGSESSSLERGPSTFRSCKSCRARKGSTGSHRHFIIVDKGTGRATSQSSVNSCPSNTNTSISNSSLQDMDESEYTGEELANCLATMNNVL